MSQGPTLHEVTRLADGACVMASLPPEIAHRAGLRAGEAACAIEPAGGLPLVPADSPYVRAVKAAARITGEHEKALRGRAKDPSG